MALSLTVKCTTGQNLLFSTSSIFKTEGDRQNTANVTVRCAQTAVTKCTVAYLERGTFKAKNSLVIRLRYYNGNTLLGSQEVVAMANNKKITSVVWKVGTTTFNENSNPITCVGGETITVAVNQTGQSSGRNPITELTCLGYYVSGHGFKTSAALPNDKPTLGSYNTRKEVAVFHRKNSQKWTEAKIKEIVGANNYTKSGTWIEIKNNLHQTSFTFKPPVGERPNYYIVIAYKNYLDGIGHMQVLDGNANNFNYLTDYWDNGWDYGGLRYTVYAIYSDGVAPGFADDYQKAQWTNAKTTYKDFVDDYFINVYFYYPPKLITVRWYNKKTKALLKDGTGSQDLVYSIRYSTVATSILIPDINNQINTKKEHVVGYYQATNSSLNSWTARSEQWFNSVVPNQDLYFGVDIEDIPYTITYKSQSSNNAHFTAYYSSTITIDPVGNARQLQSGATVKHKNPKTNGDETGQYTITNIEGNYTIQDPIQTGPEPLNLKFAYWLYNSSTNKLTAVWVPITVQIIYNPNGGNGSQQSRTAAYKENYTILHPRDVGFSGSQEKPIFVSWNTKADGSGDSYVPGRTIKPDKSMTLFAIWGSPWKKVEWIWVYEPDKPDGPKDDNGWKRHKPWINTK